MLSMTFLASHFPCNYTFKLYTLQSKFWTGTGEAKVVGPSMSVISVKSMTFATLLARIVMHKNCTNKKNQKHLNVEG